MNYILFSDIILLRGDFMLDYKKLYLMLFNAITDAIKLLEKGDCAKAAETLARAQQQTEDIVIERDE